MNTRICSIIAVVTLLSLSSGCCGVKNFLFGRGARCGLCTQPATTAPQFGNVMQAPCGQQQPYAPAVNQNPSGYSGVVTAPRTGWFGKRLFARTPAPQPCETCTPAYPMNYGDCGCGGVVDAYGPVVTDPYATSEGQIIGGQSYPGNTTPIQPDDFSARKFDSDGNRIIWEEPITQGATAL